MRRPARRPFVVLLLLVLLSSAALAAGVSSPGAPLRLGVPAPDGRGPVAFNLTTGALGGAVNVVVTHEDPLVGTVVDRVVPLTLAANTTTEVVLKDVRVGTGFTVRVVDASVPLPPLSDLTDLLDGAAVPALPSLLEGVVPLPPLSGQKHTFRGYRVVDEDRAGAPSRVFTFPSGLVAVAMSMGVEEPPGAAVLQVAVSKDGGHTFAPPVNVSGLIGNGVNGWSGAATLDGRLVLFYGERDATGATGPTLSATFDPARGRVTQRGIVEEGSSFGRHAAAALPDGGVLFVGSGLTRASAPRWHPAIEVWRMGPDGATSLLGNVSVGQPPAPLHAAVGPTGAVALVWTESDAAGSRSFRALSLDGRTFGPAVPMAELRLGDVVAAPSSVALDALGTLHVLAEGYHFDGWRNTTEGNFAAGNFTAYYGRFPAAGPAAVIPLNGAYDAGALVPGSRQADTPMMRVHGSRVWIVWADLIHVPDEDPATSRATSYGIESVDGGLTFGAPYEAETTAGPFPLSSLFDMTTFADGRPLLLARYFHSSNDRSLSVVPFFDPLPPEGAGLTLVTRTPATLPPPDDLPEGDDPQLPEEREENETLPPDGPGLPPDGPPQSTPPGPTVSGPAPKAPPAEPPGDAAPAVPEAALLAGAGALLAGAFALTEAGRYALGLVAAALYSRLSKSDVLRHEVRAGIHDHVRDHPGIRYTDLRRDLGLANGVLAFHLRVLLREGYVVARSEWTRRRFYATGAAPPGADPGDAQAVVLRLLERTPGLGAAEVAKAVGSSRQLARYHLLALERAGLVEATRQGRATRYAPASRRAPRAATTFHLVEKG